MVQIAVVVLICSADRAQLVDRAAFLAADRLPTLEKPFELDDLYTLVAGMVRPESGSSLTARGA